MAQVSALGRLQQNSVTLGSALAFERLWKIGGVRKVWVWLLDFGHGRFAS